MSRKTTLLALTVLVVLCQSSLGLARQKYRRIPVDEYVDKMKAGLISIDEVFAVS